MARIMIVDDDDLLVEGLARYLSAAGHVVEHVADGWQAVDLLREHDPDLLVLDRNMPACDGLDVLRALRRQAGIRLPILLLSARQELGDVVAAIAEGANDYLGKPCRPEELVSRVQTMLEQAAR